MKLQACIDRSLAREAARDLARHNKCEMHYGRVVLTRFTWKEHRAGCVILHRSGSHTFHDHKVNNPEK